jgi:hypothetical protein
MVSGVVQRISEKPFNGKTFYSFAMSGQDGWYGTGIKRPPAVGTSIRFNEKTNSKGYKEVDGSIETLADEAVGPVSGVSGAVSASAGQGGKSGGGSQSAYWDRKEARDIANDANRELGASRNTAISIIDLAIKHEAIKLPAAAKREEFLWTLLDRYTDKLMGRTDKGSDAKDSEKSSSAKPAEDAPVDNDNWS